MRYFYYTVSYLKKGTHKQLFVLKNIWWCCHRLFWFEFFQGLCLTMCVLSETSQDPVVQRISDVYVDSDWLTVCAQNDEYNHRTTRLSIRVHISDLKLVPKYSKKAVAVYYFREFRNLTRKMPIIEVKEQDLLSNVAVLSAGSRHEGGLCSLCPYFKIKYLFLNIFGKCTTKHCMNFLNSFS